jgi:3-hydroxyisobutyrate dehydrogenase
LPSDGLPAFEPISSGHVTAVIVAVLGTGIMGAAIARTLLRAGLRVTVWNRTRGKAEPLRREGAEVADKPDEAAAGADVVLTMLTDWDAVESAMTGPGGALARMRDGAMWLQMSTVGLAGVERARELAESEGVTLVDAPVLGTKEPAERGELIVLASGPNEALDACEPIFAAVGEKTIRLGEPGRGSAFKLLLNTWLIGLVESLAETLALARVFGFEPEQFLDTISGGPLDVSYAQLKGKAMAGEEFPPSFPLRLARKDAVLVLEAAEARGLDLPGIRSALSQLERAEELGYGDEDLAAVAQVARPGVGHRA